MNLIFGDALAQHRPIGGAKAQRRKAGEPTPTSYLVSSAVELGSSVLPSISAACLNLRFSLATYLPALASAYSAMLKGCGGDVPRRKRAGWSGCASGLPVRADWFRRRRSGAATCEVIQFRDPSCSIRDVSGISGCPHKSIAKSRSLVVHRSPWE